jgi:hypothetical protein
MRGVERGIAAPRDWLCVTNADDGSRTVRTSGPKPVQRHMSDDTPCRPVIMHLVAADAAKGIQQHQTKLLRAKTNTKSQDINTPTCLLRVNVQM